VEPKILVLGMKLNFILSFYKKKKKKKRRKKSGGWERGWIGGEGITF
jgi:hypothetical protein